MVKRLERGWDLIDKRWNEDRFRLASPDRWGLGDKGAAHEHLDDIEATDYERNLRDVVVVPFEVLYQAPRWRDPWRIEHSSNPRQAPVLEPIRVFEHDEPRWFWSDLSFPVVEIEDPPPGNYVCITAETDSGCLKAFKEIALERDFESVRRRLSVRRPRGPRCRAVGRLRLRGPRPRTCRQGTIRSSTSSV